MIDTKNLDIYNVLLKGVIKGYDDPKITLF